MIKLAEGYNYFHAAVYLLAAAITISLFVFLNSTQGFVLGEIFNIPSNKLGDYSGSLIFYDELTSICTVSLWGLLSDVIGRFTVYSIGFTLEAIALVFFVHAKSYSPELILLRVLFAIGGAATSCMLSAFLADISSESDRGKFSGLLGFCSGLGAIMGVVLFLPLPTRLGGTEGLKASFNVIAAISMATAVLLMTSSYFMPKPGIIIPSRTETPEAIPPNPTDPDGHLNSSPMPGATYTDEHVNMSPTPDSTDSDEHLNSSPTSIDPLYDTMPQPASNTLVSKVHESAKLGLLQAKNPEILLGYIASFLARSDSVSITVYLPLWIYKHYVDQGLCAEIPGNEKNSCHEAYIKASIFSGVAQIFALVGAPIFGILLDRMKSKILVVCIASVTAAIGYILLGLSSPIASINFFYLLLIGFGEIGLIVSSVALVTQRCIPVNARGAVSGMSSLMGALGILVTSKIGGLLFDWFSGAPFLFLGLIHISLLLGLGVAYYFKLQVI